jgi:8-oxo-dGTP pyrophosphatase MutT (NUDIX family)
VIEEIETWEIIKSNEIADCRVFKVRQDQSRNLTSGQEANFFVIENPDWINIIAVTEKNAVVLIEQYRQGTEEITLEIPGGLVDKGEDPAECAERELLEETGYTTDDLVYLGKSRPNPAIQTNWIYHFAAFNCKKTADTTFDEHESIRSSLVNLSEIPYLIMSEKITHSLVLAGFYRFEQYLKQKENYLYES